MNPATVSLALFVLVFVVIIAGATIRTKARHRRIRKALGLPAKMRTSTSEAQARNAVRVFEETDMKLSSTLPSLSQHERRKMARTIVKEKGLLPKASRPGTPSK
jgi:flagellar biosynthesis/type III secretory pathway M-ring protein FliF/YscJ